MKDAYITPPSSLPMHLAHVSRTIEEFFSASAVAPEPPPSLLPEEDGEASPTRTVSSRQQQQHQQESRSAAALAPLLVAQLKDVIHALRPKSRRKQEKEEEEEERNPSISPWTFAYHQSRGARAEGVRALLRLFQQQLLRSQDSEAGAVLRAAMACLVALLEQDRSHQYLAVRVWEEEMDGRCSGGEGGMQRFLLHAYVDRWVREDGGMDKSQDASVLSFAAPFSSSCCGFDTRRHARREQALFLRLWALLAASQPLSLPASDVTLLATVLLGPIYAATAASPPLSPPRRRQQPREEDDGDGEATEEGERRHPLLVPALELLAQAARGSPAFRLCLRTGNQRERNMIYDVLLSLVVSAQSEAPSTPPRLALASMGALAAVVAGDAAFEARVFERRNVGQMARLAFAHLVDGEGGDGGGGRGVRWLAAEVVGDVSRSPLLLGLLEGGDGGGDGGGGAALAVFIDAAAARLCRQQGRAEGRSAQEEPLLRSLRFLCLESSRARSLLTRALPATTPSGLAGLLDLALSPHAPTASEASGLLSACLLPLCDEAADGDGNGGLWQAVAALMLRRTDARPRTPPPSSLSASSSPVRARQDAATTTAAAQQLGRSPTRRRGNNKGGGAAAAACAPSSSLLGRLVGELQALADEVEVATAGPDGLLDAELPPLPTVPLSGGESTSAGDDDGAATAARLAVLETEWRLRSLLGLASLLLLHAPAQAAHHLAHALARRLPPRALAAIVLGFARTHARDAASDATTLLLPPTATEPLEIIVRGCRLLLRRGATMEQQDEQPHARWRSVVLGGSKEVVDALCAAWGQGSSRELLEETAAFLVALARTSGPGDASGRRSSEWCALLDAFLQTNQRRNACAAATARRLAAAEEALDEAAIEVELKDGMLETALAGQQAQALAAVQATLSGRVQELEAALEGADADYTQSLQDAQAECEGLQATVEGLSGQLAAEAAARAAAEREAAALREEVARMGAAARADAAARAAAELEVGVLQGRWEEERRLRVAAEAAREAALVEGAAAREEAGRLAAACEGRERALQISELKVREAMAAVAQADGLVRLHRARAGEREAATKGLEEALGASEAARAEAEARSEGELLGVLEEVTCLRRLVEARGREVEGLKAEREGMCRRLAEKEAALAKMRVAVRAVRASLKGGGEGSIGE